MTRWTVGLFLLLAVFHGARLTPLHGWSDDGAMYLRHTMNLLEGRDYGDTLQSATRSVAIQPLNYPPVLSVLLVPFVKLWGLDFFVLKTVMLVLFLGALAALLLPLRALVSPWQALGIIAALGFNPVLAQIAAHINSDILFLLVFAVALWWFDSSRGPLGALLVVLAAGTRVVGAILLPALLIHDLWRHRRLTRATIATVALSIPMLLLIRTGGDYASFLSGVTWMSIRRNLIQLPLATGGFLGGGLALSTVLIGLAAAGLYPIARDKKPLWLVFAAIYLAVLIVWPFSDPERFLLPVLPLFCVGIARALSHVPRAAPLALALVFAREAMLYPANSGDGAGLNYPSTLALYDAVRRETTPADRIAFRKARSLALFTERRSYLYPYTIPATVTTDFCAARITYVAAAPRIFPDDAAYLQPWIEAHSKNLTLIFRNGEYSLYRLAPDMCGSLGL